MSINDLRITTIGNGQWQVAFTPSVSTTLTVWIDGALARTYESPTAGQEITYTFSADEPAIVDVLEGTGPPEEVYPDRVTLGWYRVDGAQSYRVDEYVDGSWTERARIPDIYARDGEYTWYYTWRSRRLEDGQTHQFRVVPEGPGEVAGTAVQLQSLIVRHPDPPAPEYSYDSDTGVLTISEA